MTQKGDDDMYKIVGQYIGGGGQVKQDICYFGNFKLAWQCREKMLLEQRYMAVWMVFTEGGTNCE